MKHFLTTLTLFLSAATIALADVTGRVVAVTDGDTIKVLDSYQVEHKVRLTGIDAPEREQAALQHGLQESPGFPGDRQRGPGGIHQIGPVRSPLGEGLGAACRLPLLR